MTGKNDSLDKIREAISESKEIVLCGHTNPDGDAIGASLALAASLEKAGKRVRVLLEHPYAAKYSVIPNEHLLAKVEEIDEAELFISLDCGDMGRLTGVEEVFAKAKNTINIDHHSSNSYFAKLNYVEVDASSTSEVVYLLINGYFPIDKGIAAGLYAGLIYDTGGFRHTSTGTRTMQIAGELMEYGIPFTKIYNELFDSRSFTEVKIMGKALDKAKLYFGNEVVVSSITTAEIAKIGGSNKEMDSIINYLKGVMGTKIACFFYEKSATDVKASFRCNEGYDVCALAQKFGGGGHIKAAGCTISAPIEQVQEMVLAEVEKLL